MTDGPPGNETNDESAPLGFEPGTQWSEVEGSTAQPSAPHLKYPGTCKCKTKEIVIHVVHHKTS